MKIRLPIFLAATVASLSHAEESAPRTVAFGIHFADRKNSPMPVDSIEGVVIDHWTTLDPARGYHTSDPKVGTLKSPAPFEMAAGPEGIAIKGSYASKTYWNPHKAAPGISPVYRSTLDSTIETGLPGYASVIQFGNIGPWLKNNRCSSLKVTVYYSAYDKTGDGGDAAGVLAKSTAKIFSGTIDGAPATFVDTHTALGDSAGKVEHSGGAFYLKGSIIDNITSDFVVAQKRVPGEKLQGGIAAIKIEGVRIPEPSTYGLMGAGVLVVATLARRRRR